MKDKTNLLSFNVWSGTEYSNNNSNLTFDGTKFNLKTSNDFSSNGECSLKIISTQDPTYNYIRLYTGSTVTGETYNGSIHILNKTIPKLTLRIIENNTNLMTDVIIVKSDNIQEINVSRLVNDSNISFSLIYGANIPSGVVYIDNIRLSYS